MSVSKLSFALLLITAFTPSLSNAQDSVIPDGEIAASDIADHDVPDWNCVTQPIPEILRLHLPRLRNGLWVESVVPGGAAEGLGLRAGDILLQINGRPVMGPDSLIPPQKASFVMVLRRGQVRVIPPAMAQRRGPFAFGGPNMGASSWASSAASSASASGNGEAVSISQAGNRFTVEMSLPSLPGQPVRLSGTREQIDAQIAQRNDAPEVAARIREALASAGF